MKPLPCICGRDARSIEIGWDKQFLVECTGCSDHCDASTPNMKTPELAVNVWNAMQKAAAAKKPESSEAKRPRGKIPEDTKAWLKANPHDWKLAICECGRWFTEMDHLAPYHNEGSRCAKCDKISMQEAARKEEGK